MGIHLELADLCQRRDVDTMRPVSMSEATIEECQGADLRSDGEN